MATGWQPAHETVTYSGIDTEDFPVAPPVARPWRGRLVCAGRIEPRKGFRTVIEALPRLPADLTLTAVGPDQAGHTDDLRALARELGVAGRVTFTCVPRDRMREVYADADAVVFPSAWQEPFGLVPVEAMACGVPVVAAPTGGAREFLADGLNCLAVPPGDPSAIVAAVERLAAEPTLRAALTAAGARTAADLTVDRLTDVLEQWHVAASLRYRDGEPPPRPPVSPCAPTPT
jgi:glycosyltransferase involved in cell wall biosynthesis